MSSMQSLIINLTSWVKVVNQHFNFFADESDRDRFDTTIGIPTNLPDGDYVLQITMLVGNTGSPYNSCGRIRITGGNTGFSCKNNDPVLVYKCLQSGGPKALDTIAKGLSQFSCFVVYWHIHSIQFVIYHSSLGDHQVDLMSTSRDLWHSLR